MKNIKNQEFYEKAKARYKRLNLFFSILSILVMLAYPIFAIMTERGNKNINIAVLVVSIIYGAFWLILGSKKAYKINRIYKWSRLLLSFVSLAINAYSIYITATNFNFVAIIMSIAMGTFWVINVIFNIIYDVVSYKLAKIIDKAKNSIAEYKNKKNTPKQIEAE